MRLFFLCVLSALATTLFGQAGKPDASFGGTGWVQTKFGTSKPMPEIAKQAFFQPDGRYAVVTTINYRTVLAGFLPDGSVDTSFGINGYSDYTFEGHPSNIYSRAVQQPDGKIIIAGSTFLNNEMGLLLVRFHPNGLLDKSFGKEGIVTKDVGPDAGFFVPYVQPDGKIIVGGNFVGGENNDLFLLRFTADGTEDTGFRAYRQTPIPYSSYLATMAVVAGGEKIYVAGIMNDGNNNFQLMVKRYNSDGILDVTYNNSGISAQPVPWPELKSLTLTDDHQILAAGITPMDPYRNFSVLRLQENGTLNPFVYNNETPSVPLPENAGLSGEAVAIQPDGKFVVASTLYGSLQGISVARYLPDGAPDLSFGNQGYQFITFDQPAAPLNISIQANGNILVTGLLNVAITESVTIRLYPNGSVDESFSGDGKSAYHYPAEFSALTGIAQQADGKLVTVGGSSERLVLARYLTSGALDPTFNGTGKVYTDLSSDAEGAQSVVLQPDGKIIVAGFMESRTLYTYGLFIARYLPDGSIDKSFGNNGLYEAPYNTSFVNSVLLQDDGKILALAGNNDRAVILRLDPDGSPDNTFDRDGALVLDPGGIFYGPAFALQKDGKIVITGSFAPTYNDAYHILAVRLNGDGSFDKSFDGDGKKFISVGTEDHAASLAIQADGKILITGKTYSHSSGNGSPQTDVLLIRLLTDGKADVSLSGDGMQIVNIRSVENIPTIDEGARVLVQSNGKIIVAGSSTSEYLRTTHFDLLRFHPDGSLDVAFGENGIADFRINLDDMAFVYGAMVQDGRVYVTGSTQAISTNAAIIAFQLGSSGCAALEAAIPDAKALPYTGVTPNTLFTGYAAAKSVTLSATVSNGLPDYRYLWSDGNKTVGTAASLTVLSPGTYTVTVTDANNCSTTASKTITETNVGCGNANSKVNICHVNDKNLLHDKTICIDANAVEAHLQHGCSLGACALGTVTRDSRPSDNQKDLAIRVAPNPAADHFRISIESGNMEERISLKVIDMQGKVIASNNHLYPNQVLQLGDSFRPGIYLVEVIQGNRKRQLKLVKTGN